MKEFRSWVETRRELATQYKRKLAGVPQNPIYHPEGDALAHSRLVRKALPAAISALKALQQQSPVLSAFNFDINDEEKTILAVAAYLHDIGKASATTVGGIHYLTNVPLTGRISSRGHEHQKAYLPHVQDLQKVAPADIQAIYKQYEPTIRFMIDHHMDLMGGQFGAGFIDKYFENGRLKPSQPMKLLLILMWMDKMDRPDGIASNAAALQASAKLSAQKYARINSQSKPFEGTPADFAIVLKSKDMTPSQRVKALRGKFPQLTPQNIQDLLGESLNFKTFVETMDNSPTTLHADIPVDQDVLVLDKLLRKDDETQVYMVGGCVRDWLNQKFGRSSQGAKDIDLTTNLSEEEILKRLRSTEAKQAGVRVKEKESVDTFGVVFANIKNGENYEIAPFRKDIGIADGRHPDRVEQGNIYDDAMRRDLTMNNLYYDFHRKLILDYNPNGQGIEDVRTGVARPVGDPNKRFAEDKLRVLRLVRFFSRFNSGRAVEVLDDRTKAAIEQFKQLEGISPERVVQEFVGGIEKSLNTSAYLQNLLDLGLMPTVFPKLNVNQNVARIGNSKNVRAILAWLLKDNPNVGARLNQLKYPNEISGRVDFLLKLYQVFHATLQQHKLKASLLAKERDKFIDPNYDQAQQNQMRAEAKADIDEFSRIAGEDLNQHQMQHFAVYQTPNISGEDLMKKGFVGPQIGAEQSRLRDDHYQQSLDQYNNLG